MLGFRFSLKRSAIEKVFGEIDFSSFTTGDFSRQTASLGSLGWIQAPKKPPHVERSNEREKLQSDCRDPELSSSLVLRSTTTMCLGNPRF